MISWLGRYWRTLRTLKISQIFWLVFYKLYSPKPDLSPAPSLRSHPSDWQVHRWRPSALKDEATFCFLNHKAELGDNGHFGPSDDWNDPRQSLLWLYNLHYFDYLNSKGADSQSEHFMRLIARWIDENPPGQGAGWAPYTLSLRIVNLIKWFLAGQTPQQAWLDSLAAQTRFLCSSLEYHILGNHLYANGKALVFAGVFFKGKEADRWLSKGLNIINTQISEQILDDGGHFERSPMYQALILEDMLDLCNLVAAYDTTLPQKLIETAKGWPHVALKMRQWLAAMSHPDGQISFFNDAAFDSAALPSVLESYANALQHPPLPIFQEPLQALETSGYLRVSGPQSCALIDVAPVGPDYQPGHAHADTLSFELSLYDQRVFVNSGTSEYGQSPERHRQRGTPAHNTVTINDQNSSEVWAGFRVGRRAKVRVYEASACDSDICISASHDGYCWLHPDLIHKRDWHFGAQHLVLTDIVKGPFETAAAMFHLHPAITVQHEADSNRAELLLESGQVVSFVVSGGGISVLDGYWHPSFGVCEANQCLKITFQDACVETTIKWY